MGGYSRTELQSYQEIREQGPVEGTRYWSMGSNVALKIL